MLKIIRAEMSIKLIVFNDTTPDEKSEFLFDQDSVSIGRHSSNDLVLPDAQRVVGRYHAKIERADGAFKITDLRSKNFTYLKEDRLEGGQAYDLADLDRVKVGDFNIQFFDLAGGGGDDATMMGESLANPFDDDAKALAEILDRIANTYKTEKATQRNLFLKTAIRQSMAGKTGKGAALVIGEVLNPEAKQQAPVKQAAGVSPVAMKVIEALLVFIARLVKLPSQFRQDFVGQKPKTGSTGVNSTFSIERCTAGDLKTYLIDGGLSSSEFNERLQLIQDAAEEGLKHERALLDGYRAGVYEGSQQLLRAIDPIALRREEVVNQNWIMGPVSIPYKMIPFMVGAQLVKLIDERHNELTAVDQAVFEKKVFRPSFVRSYLKSFNKGKK